MNYHIDKKLIDRIISGEVTETPAPLCVIREVVGSRINEEVCHEWKVFSNPREDALHCVKVDRHEAMKVIDNLGLEPKCVVPELGVLYDTPDQQYLKEYKRRAA